MVYDCVSTFGDDIFTHLLMYFSCSLLCRREGAFTPNTHAHTDTQPLLYIHTGYRRAHTHTHTVGGSLLFFLFFILFHLFHMLSDSIYEYVCICAWLLAVFTALSVSYSMSSRNYCFVSISLFLISMLGLQSKNVLHISYSFAHQLFPFLSIYLSIAMRRIKDTHSK